MSYEELDRAYRRAFGVPPPRDFRRAYAILRDALYWGTASGDKDEAVGRRKKRPGEYWPFHRWQLLEPKARADEVLAEIACALQRWEAEG